MILFVIGLFSLAAFIGLSMVILAVRYRRGSLALGLGHAGIASLAFVLLLIEIFHAQARTMIINDAAILFAMTLAGGLVLLALREGRKPPPMVVVGIHAAMALFALLLLVMGYLRS
jgi:hypothetical protein